MESVDEEGDIAVSAPVSGTVEMATPMVDEFATGMYHEACSVAAGIGGRDLSPEQSYMEALDFARTLERRLAAAEKALSVFEVVQSEVDKAVAKFPTWPTDPLHALAVVGEEYGELNKAVLQLAYEPHKTSMQEVTTEAIQTAAMAMRFLHSLHTYKFTRCAQHTQAALPPTAEGSKA